jgi:hypothetical protein
MDLMPLSEEAGAPPEAVPQGAVAARRCDDSDYSSPRINSEAF